MRTVAAVLGVAAACLAWTCLRGCSVRTAFVDVFADRTSRGESGVGGLVVFLEPPCGAHGVHFLLV